MILPPKIAPLLKIATPLNVVDASVVVPMTVSALLKIAFPLNRLNPFSVVLESVILDPEVKLADDPPELELLVTEKNEPPPPAPSRPSFPFSPFFPAGPGTETYLVMYVTVLVEIKVVLGKLITTLGTSGAEGAVVVDVAEDTVVLGSPLRT